ncbi:MAG TPA: LamG domain-containing protein, partial [Isosphaeraceae bacterium]
SAPAAMGALGCPADPSYVPFLPSRIAAGIAQADRNLAPARIGWAVIDDPEHTHCRRWIRRPDKMLADPFGGLTVRANMHPGYQNPDAIAPSGPVDPGLSALAVQALDGRPIALLANYSMHYFGVSPVSADYYGRFAERMKTLIGAADVDPPFVGIMSQGTSGDQHWMDYGQPQRAITLDAYADAVAARAFEAYQAVVYHDWVPLAMAETRLTLRRRVPAEPRLAWARPIVAQMAGRVPRNQVEVYAQEALFLHEDPVRELKLQAVRIGELGIVAIPDEVFALTGLKLKARSPLTPTFTIELANGSEGYIPPPEQHALGGYTTWPARTAALEVQAEPKIVDAVLGLLEQVAGRPRRPLVETHGPYARSVLDAQPLAYWRLGEMTGPTAIDATGHQGDANYEGGVAYYLEGPPSPGFSGPGIINRAPHFAGGWLNTGLERLGPRHSIELWFWNGLPSDARPVTGTLVALGAAERLVLGGTRSAPGRLVYTGDGSSPPLVGTTAIAPKTWNHVVLVREDKTVTVYLNGEPDLSGAAPVRPSPAAGPLTIGGGTDRVASFEGKIDEVAAYDRALTPAEIAARVQATDPSSDR